MGLDGEGFLGGFFCLVVLFLFRLVEQTELVRTLNRQLLDQTIEYGKLQARISELEAERKMKLCEKRGCIDRQPQSGY